MSPKFSQHADAGPWHYETKCVDGIWEWEIFESSKGKIASGHARTLDEAKAFIITETGRAPDTWKNIGPRLPQVLTSEEKTIAEAAVQARPATNAVQLESDIAAGSKMGALDVKRILGELVDAGVLKICVTPARNLATPNPPPQALAQIWYEKDSAWPQE
jgi:hypothetical protein